MKFVVEHFDSIEVFTKTIMQRKPNSVFKGKNLSSEKGTESFTGSRSLQQALDIMKNGYEEPLAKIKKTMLDVKAKSNTPVQKIRPTIGVVGFAPCVPNAIRGLPNSMISVDRVPMKSKVLTIMYSIGVNAATKTDEMIEAGTAVLKLINELELKGYRVRLNVEFIGCYEGDREFASVTVNVKDWRQHIDLKKLAFPLVHPSALRRVAFRWLETVPNLSVEGFKWGYGKPKNNDGYDEAKDFYQKHGLCDEKTYYINVAMVQECDHDTRRMMEKCGIAQAVKEGA